ncbi:Extracellular serine/threonine protein [Dirofilaria immitis]
MRIYIRKLAVIVCIIFFTTIILLSVIRKDENSEWLKRYQKLNFPRPIPHAAYVQEQNIYKLMNEDSDVSRFFVPYINWTLAKQLDQYLFDLNISEMIAKECPSNETLRQVWKDKIGKVVPERDSWEKFYADIGSCDVYRNDEVIKNLLNDLTKLPLKSVSIMDGGTQVKLIFTFENDQQAVFKPMRFGRDYESDPNHFYFSDFERHNAEIATFHMDKILGFRRAIPTVGRIVNLTSDLRNKAEKRLAKTFFISPAKNLCFVSKCDYYCDTSHAICGTPDTREGSVQVFLPDENSVPRKHNKSPYRRTYSKKNQIAEWQRNMDYCRESVKTTKPYAHGRMLLDLIDFHVMDYLIGNQDRHHYEAFSIFVPSYAIHLDNGRAFGRTDFDDDDILLPLRQCCVLRSSTFLTLLKYYREPISLTKALHQSMSKDPLSPILAYKHYPAMERRLHNVMVYIDKCIRENPDGPEGVIMAEYHNNEVPIALDDNIQNNSEFGVVLHVDLYLYFII